MTISAKGLATLINYEEATEGSVSSVPFLYCGVVELFHSILEFPQEMFLGDQKSLQLEGSCNLQKRNWIRDLFS